MRKDEYIREVVSHIDNKKAKREVEKELSAHIDDRISYYTDAGWDEETANEKAMEHMGEPEKQAEQLGKVHNNKSKNVILAVLNPISLAIFNLLWFLLGNILNDVSSDWIFIIWTAAYIILCVVQFIIGKRVMTAVDSKEQVHYVIIWSVVVAVVLSFNPVSGTLMFYYAWGITETYGFDYSGILTWVIGLFYIILPIISQTFGLINNRKED